MTFQLLDLFSGIGGFSLAARWLGGFETVAFVERDPYCQRVLRRHWPDVPIFDDVCTYEPLPGSADVVCGGFPCQDISTAGKQAGIKEGTRSGLFYELMHIVRLVGPQYVVLENVAAITSNGLDSVLGTLAEAGFDAEWACIPAADVGACHRRDRWWCVAYAQGRRRGTGTRQGAGKAGYKGAGVGDGGARSDAAYASHLLGNGSQVGHAGPNGSASVSEFGDGGGKAIAHAHRQRPQRPHQPGGSRSEWPPTPARLDPNWRGYLSEPVLCRGDDGLSDRVDRLRALGNAVVPQVAMIPLTRVLELSVPLQFNDPAN